MGALLPSADLYSQAARGLDKYVNPDSLVNTIQSAVNVYMPAAYAIAFVLLTSGAMREFLYPETRRFFGTLLRTLVLVACMSGAPTLVGWFKSAANALAEMPSGVSFSINDTAYSLGGSQAPTLTQLESALQSKVQLGSTETGGAVNSKSSWSPLDWLGSSGKTLQGMLSGAQHIAWEVLFAIFLLWLLLCKVVIILMLFIQKVIVIGFTLYMPIAIGEYAHRSLKSKAVSFFLTFVGVLVWPVGWSLVNAVTMGILKSVPAPGGQNFVTLLVAIVAAIPVFLWILIGYVVAPIYVQKVVARGGAAIQGFVGTMISTVGQSSAAAVAGALGAPAAVLSVGRLNSGGGAQKTRSEGRGPRSERIRRIRRWNRLWLGRLKRGLHSAGRAAAWSGRYVGRQRRGYRGRRSRGKACSRGDGGRSAGREAIRQRRAIYRPCSGRRRWGNQRDGIPRNSAD
ncbi:MAG TPA: hypothetical protein VJX28_03290 [Chthoniobacterales bacterium]|nr:hypothetical protein [Chthoniobacterales bacterium]